jgi:putative endonuclease
MKNYYIYILTNKSKTLYIGVTNNLNRRVYEHKSKLIEGFTKKYNLDKLVYFEVFNNIEDAIRREKQLKIGIGNGK